MIKVVQCAFHASDSKVEHYGGPVAHLSSAVNDSALMLFPAFRAAINQMLSGDSASDGCRRSHLMFTCIVGSEAASGLHSAVQLAVAHARTPACSLDAFTG